MSLSSKAKHFSYKTLLLIIVFLLIPIVFLLRLNQRANPASAGWFDEGWNYRVAINIGNTSGSTLTDFQVSISIGTSALITAGKMQSDCDDIRITDINGKILPYWFSGCNTDTTQVWPKIPNIPISGVTVYVYYGNPSATAGKSTIGTSAYPGLSCKSILDAGNSTGTSNYWIDPTNGNTSDKFQAYCDMTNDSGGWMLVTASMINSEIGVSVTTTKTTNTNGGVDISNLNNHSGCGASTYYRALFTDIIPWTKIKADYEFLGGNSCWAIFGNTGYNADANLTQFASATDTIRNQVKMGGSNGDNYDGINTRCDNLTINFWHSNQGVGTTRSAQVILRRNSMGSLAGLGTGISCTTVGYPWKYKNIYIREDTMTYAATAGTPATEEVGRGPVAYWKFDEGVGSTVNNSAENKTFTGSITGPTWQTEDQCLSGKCLYQDGLSNKYTKITPNITSGWAANNDFTINLWFNCMGEGISVGSTQYNYLAGLFIHGTSADSGTGGFYLRQSSINCANMIFQVSATTVSRSITPNLTSGLNKWAMITAQKEGDTLRLYENSKLVGSQTFAGENWNVNINAQTLIGSVHGRSVKGFIDEVKIYPYARTAAEIKQDYNLGAAALVGHEQEIAQVTPISSKLLAHYKFDEGYSTNAHDSTSNVYTGTIATPIWSSDGVYNKALGFDGTNTNLVLPDALGTIANFGGTDGVVTFSMWLYVETDNTGVTIMHNLGGAWAYFGLNTSGVFQGMVYNCTTPANYWPTSATPIPLNTWTHVVSEFSGDGYKFYINGKLDKSVSDSNVCFNKPGTPHFGLDNIGWANFKGKIDDLKIYNSALTADEIKLDYNQGSAMQLGSLSSGTGNTAPSSAASQEYCVPGDTSTCSPPIAEWKFEEGVGTTAYDTSGNGNNGGWNGTGTHWDTGKVGKAGKFNGTDDFVLGPYNSSIDIRTNQISLFAWIYPKANVANGTIITKSSSYYLQRHSDGTLAAYQYGTSPAGYHYSTGTVPLNQWSYVGYIYNGNQLIFYINGQPSGSVDKTGNITPTGGYETAPVRIGWDSSAGARYFNGLIDQARIYNYARSPAQIAWDYNQGAPVARYKFDECQGTVAHDSVGTNNGTITIGASGSQTSAGTCQTANTAWGVGATSRNNASLNFDGTDDIVSVPAISGNSAIQTFSFWIYIRGAVSGNQYVIDQGGNNNCMNIYNNHFRIITNASYIYDSVTIPTTNRWYFITKVFDGSRLYLYVDGRLDGSIVASGVTPSSITLGNYSGGGNYHFNGQIDDVQVYNYALTTAQVKTVYNDGAVNFR